MRVIESARDLQTGLDELLRLEPGFAMPARAVGALGLRRDAGGFAALAGIVVSQQVSLAAARTMRARLGAAGLLDPAALARAEDRTLAGCGLSRAKIRALRALAGAGLDHAALAALPDAEIRRRLMALPGIGRWSAELYLLQSLGRADVFPAGDLALRVAAGRVFALPARPSEPALRAMAAPWSPVRAVAARLLWAYYGRMRNHDGSR